MKPAMDAIFLIADNDVRCRGELRRFLSNSGFLVAAVANGLECLAQLVALEPDVLVIAMEIPWGGGDGVIERRVAHPQQAARTRYRKRAGGSALRTQRSGAVQLFSEAAPDG